LALQVAQGIEEMLSREGGSGGRKVPLGCPESKHEALDIF